MSWYRFPSRYSGTCMLCNKRFPGGTEIEWDNVTKKTKHTSCITKFKNKIHYEKIFSNQREIQIDTSLSCEKYGNDEFQERKKQNEFFRDL